MEYVLVMAGTLLLCWLADKGFTRVFRSKPQHMSGQSVRLHKYYGVGGVLVTVLGIVAILYGVKDTVTLLAAGIFLVLVGICLMVYYMTFGVYYDEESFVLTTFGKKSVTYAYRQITGQQLYNSHGNILIELFLDDGRAVQLQSTMQGVYPFMDKAFSAWLRQKGMKQEECAFYDPQNSCWFPPVEG